MNVRTTYFFSSQRLTSISYHRRNSAVPALCGNDVLSIHEIDESPPPWRRPLCSSAAQPTSLVIAQGLVATGLLSAEDEGVDRCSVVCHSNENRHNKHNRLEDAPRRETATASARPMRKLWSIQSRHKPAASL